MDTTVTVLPIAKATSKKTVQVSKLSVVNEKGKAISVPYDENLNIATIRTWFVNGSAVVKNGKTVLTYGTDYTVEAVSGEDYTQAGTHKFIIKGVDKSADISADVENTTIWYAGEKTVTFTVNGTNLAKAKIAGLKTTVEYTGNAITLEDLFNESDKNLKDGWDGVTLYTVTGSGKNAVYTALEKGTDYTVSMSNTGVVGKFDLVFTGINGCAGSIKKTITVKAHAIKSGVTATVDVTPTYVKSGAKPKVTVKYGETVLVEGIDYTVSYKNNAKVFTADLTDAKLAKSAPTAMIKGIGNYAGTGLNATFNITPASVKQISVEVKDVTYNASKSGKSGYFLVAPKLMDDGKAVTTGKNKDLDAIAKTDYSYTYHVDTVLGDGTVRAAGDTVQAKDKVMPGTIIAVSVPVSVSYANSPYTNTVAGTKDILVGYYKVIGAANNISKYTVKISDTGKNKLFVNNGDPVVLTKNDFEVYVKTGKNPELLSAENYEIVSITGNKSVGTATVTLSGKGEYGGTKKVTFKISAMSVR